MGENHQGQASRKGSTPMGWESGQPNWRSKFASEGAIEPQDLASFVAFYGNSDEPPDPQFLGTVSPVALDNLIRGVNQDDDEGKKIIALFGQVVWSKVVPPLSGQFEQQIQQLSCGVLSTNKLASFIVTMEWTPC